MADQTTLISKYDDANFKVIREARLDKCQAGVSLVDFAHFYCRNKVLVRAVHARLHSAASVAAGSLVVVRSRTGSAATIQTKSLLSATSAGSISSITLSSLNTLGSINDYIALRLKGNDKGKWDVVYEYQVLPPSMTAIGS